MSQPPIVLYSARGDAQAALQFLAERLPRAAITGQGEDWKEIAGVWKRGLFKPPLALRVTHDLAYYTQPGFTVQKAGMTSYLRGFAGAEEQPALFDYIARLDFAVSFQFTPGMQDADPRAAVMLEMARWCDGILFLPEAVLDGHGKIILSASDSPDPDARIPAAAGAVEPPAGDDSGSDAPAEGEGVEEPLHPPSAERAAKRMQVLIAGAARGFIEETSDPEGAQPDIDLFIEALQRSGAWDEAEPEEVRCLTTPIGQLPDEDRWRLTWQCEAAATIAWALGLYELPDYDHPVNTRELLRLAGLSLPGDGPAPEALVQSAMLRSAEELELMERRIFTLHWRVRDFSLKPEAMDFRTFPERAWFGPVDTGLAKFAGDDLAINGKPIAECDEPEWRAVSGVLAERHQAINWLRGHAELYSDTGIST